jgi:chromosomal replication initiation ATPase DnaA
MSGEAMRYFELESGGRLRFQKLRTDPDVFLLAQLVAHERRVALTHLLRRSRGSGHAASARQLAIYLAHVLLERPQDVVADLFQRKRTTVAHSVQAVEDLRDDPRIEAEIERIELQLEAARTVEMQHAA